MFLRGCLVLAGIIAVTNAGLGGSNNCGIDLDFEFDFLSTTFTNEAKKDTDSGEFLSFEIPTNVTKWNFKANNLLDIDVKDRKVSVTTSAEFANVDRHISDKNPSIEIFMEFTCGEGYEDHTSFTFIQPLIDTNDHAPKFNRETYSYRFGMPIREGAVLTELLEVYAVDLDMTNDEVEFSIEANDYIKVEGIEDYYGTAKVYYATLTTLKELPKGFSKSYTITVKDHGEEPKTGTATVKIQID